MRPGVVMRSVIATTPCDGTSSAMHASTMGSSASAYSSSRWLGMMIEGVHGETQRLNALLGLDRAPPDALPRRVARASGNEPQGARPVPHPSAQQGARQLRGLRAAELIEAAAEKMPLADAIADIVTTTFLFDCRRMCVGR